MKKVELTEEALEMVANRFRLLADPMRLRILHTLGTGEMNVGEVVAATRAGQANVSKHLSAMLEAGIVSRRKDGLNAIYSVSDETIFELCDVVCARLKAQMENRQNALSGFIS